MNIRDIANLAGVSPATVSLVMNNKRGVSEDKRKEILDIVKQYSYKPSNRRRRRTGTAFCLLKYRKHGYAIEENKGFIATIVDKIDYECRQYNIDLRSVNIDSKNVEEVLKDTKDKNYDGIMVIASELLPEDFKHFEGWDKPLVMIDNNMNEGDFDTITMDNHLIAKKAFEYLYNMGHREISYLKSSEDINNTLQRFDSYLESCKNYSIRPRTYKLRMNLRQAYEDMLKILNDGDFKPHGALLADNDTIAIGAMHAILEKGYKVPKDVSIIGVDDIPFASVMLPPLTTMKISRTALAKLAVDLLRRRMRYPEWPKVHIKVTADVTERQSVKKLDIDN